MTRLARVLSAIGREGKQVILVSSGAVGVGAGRLGISGKPAKLSDKQALAALGQAELIKIYQRIFRDDGQLVAQVLLTRDGMEDPVKKTNARNTLKTLLAMGVIPIINENDTVSTREMEFGDNDQLSARVCKITGADLLVLLSDIDGLYSADPRRNKQARLIPLVYNLSEEVEAAAGGAGTDVGTGGMATKLEDARICRLAGTHMVIANGEDHRNSGYSGREGSGNAFYFSTGSKHKIIETIRDIRQVAGLHDPIGEILGMTRRPNGLMIGKRRVPFGVVGIIYEARQNVIADAFALCLKTGNASILRGGKEAISSNKVLVDLFQDTLSKQGFPPEAIQLVADTSRESAVEMMKARGIIDLLIPRGGSGFDSDSSGKQSGAVD